MFTNRISNNLDQLQFFVEFLNENYKIQKHLSLTLITSSFDHE